MKQIIYGTITITHEHGRSHAECICHRFAAGGPHHYVLDAAHDHHEDCLLNE